LREGIEAFLIVAITLPNIRKTGRTWLFGGLWGDSLRGCALLGAAQLFGKQTINLFGRHLASVAALMVLSMVIYMMRVRGAAFRYRRK